MPFQPADELAPACQPHPAGVVLRLRVMPNAPRTTAAGLRETADGTRLLLRVHAPPVDGKANAEVLRWVADQCGVAKGQVSLLRGEKSREKDVLITVQN